MKYQLLIIACITPLLTACGDGVASYSGLGQQADQQPILENANLDSPFIDTANNQTSTFSIDVDTAAYSIMRETINRGELPDTSQVRLEEYINYFNYDYSAENIDHPFNISTQLGTAPWFDSHKLLKIALKGKSISTEDRGASNLIFLIDTSGSMKAENKLPLLKQAMLLLVDQLTIEDSIGIITYAGQAGIALEPTLGDKKEEIKQVINSLQAGGSTNGEAGIYTAYDLASLNYNTDGINRVILATDGDFNVGQTSSTALIELIQSKAESSIYLTTLGFGTYYNDNLLESLADNGDGNYAYIDSLEEAKKVLVAEANGTLITLAKDVKIQITFNEDIVLKYRLLGYNNRRLSDEDFDNDSKDAGDMGAGHTVVAFYELDLAETEPEYSGNLLANIDVRYKEPNASQSKLYQHSSYYDEMTNNDFFFAAAVAEYAMILSNSSYKNNANLDNVLNQAELYKGPDLYAYRQEFIDLVNKTKTIAPDL